MQSVDNKITLYYCFRAEMQNQIAMRVLRTEYRFWYLVARDIENEMKMNGPLRQQKKVEKTFIGGKVVGKLLREENLRMSELKEAESCVPSLEPGSTMENGDIIVLTREPSKMYFYSQSLLWKNWQAFRLLNNIPANVTFEDSKQLAQRYKTPLQFAHLVRGVQHNFDVGSQSSRHELLTEVEQLEYDEEEKARLSINFTPAMTEDDRIALVCKVGAKIFNNDLLAQQSQQQQQQQQKQQNDVERNDGSLQPVAKRQRRNGPPVNYVCNRCRVPGHWLQECPTRGDKEYDRARIVKPTGIPLSMLQKVENVDESNGDVAIMKIGNTAYRKIDRNNRFNVLMGISDDKDAE